jgi:hypothetical protein
MERRKNGREKKLMEVVKGREQDKKRRRKRDN